MEILVSQRPIDFEIEGGETLGEVVLSLNEWAAKGGNVILGLKLNGQPIPFEEAIASSRKVEEIETLEIEMRGIREMAVDSLYEARDYLPKLIAGIGEAMDLVKLKEFTDGLVWIEEVIAKTSNLLRFEYNKIYTDLESIEEKRERLKGVERELRERINEGNIEGVTTILKKKVKPILEDWERVFHKLIEGISQMEAPQRLFSRLKEVLTQIPIISKEIEEVSIDLQTGNEVKAMEEFKGIIDRLSDMIDLLRQVRSSFNLDYQTLKVKDQTVKERTQEMDELLSEIITAFEDKDIVMLADLLEYELSPLLSRWEEVIMAITTEVESKISQTLYK